MPSFTSSSDAGFALRLVLWAGAFTALGCVLARLADGSPVFDRIHQMPQFELAGAVEQFERDPHQASIILLGSSAARELPPEDRQRQGVFTMSLLGYSSLLGLEVLARSDAAPKLVLVEGTLGFRHVPADILADETDNLPRRLHAALPITQARFHWLNLLWLGCLPLEPELFTPAMSWQDWRAHRRPWLGLGLSAFTTPYAVKNLAQADQRIARYRELIGVLERRGTRVVFYDLPVDPEIQALPAYVEWQDEIHAAFADHAWLADAPEGYYLYDGIHFTSGSGERFFDLLMQGAEGPPGP